MQRYIASYREHLIIQTAEMYKLVNLLITTMASFPTFENLMQQQPIDSNNNIVSDSLNYISQYNSHLASLMSQQSQQQQQHSDTHSQRTNNTNNINNNSQLINVDTINLVHCKYTTNTDN